MNTHQLRPRPKQRLTPLRSFKRRERRYPIWSVRSTVATFLLGMLLTALLVIFLGKKSLIVELEITLGIVAAGLFLFLAIGLYRGARVRKNEVIAGDLKFYSTSDSGGSTSWPDVSFDVGGGDDVLGCIGGLLLGILVSILFVVFLIIFINVAIVFFFVFMLALGWIFQRALRNVFAKSRRCRGDLVASLGYAGFYTFLYTGWLLLILLAVDWFRPK